MVMVIVGEAYWEIKVFCFIDIGSPLIASGVALAGVSLVVFLQPFWVKTRNVISLHSLHGTFSSSIEQPSRNIVQRRA